MPKERIGRHNAESLGYVAERIGSLHAQVLVQKELLAMMPVDAVEVAREASLEQGLARLTAWSDSLRDAIHVAKLISLRTPKRPVSESADGREKPKKTK